ncbi:MAG: uroporphyrinogen decarboxylase family protein, partial [Desulfatiglandales bacterium]|nr:uroporphyrinogen decarboxylase family protein [Desulfatiglandales bacterium]
IGLTLQWLSHIQVPGRELPDDALWQVDEKEVMSVEDYDIIINKGFKAFRKQHLPKIIDIAELQEKMEYMKKNKDKTIQMFRDHSYVIMSGGITTVPFELLCGARSMTPFILDLYRRPEKVKAALDIMTQGQIDLGIQAAQDSGINRVWLGGWRTASALLSPKIWNEFVFPYLHEMAWALAEKGIVSILHLDQDWTRDLGRLRELPSKKCILNPDGMTDIHKAKKLIGDHMAIMGDVPAAMLATGTSDEVYNYVRDLVRDIGPTGLLLCPGCDAPINARRENMEAFVSAGRDFGAI